MQATLHRAESGREREENQQTNNKHLMNHLEIKSGKRNINETPKFRIQEKTS